MTSIRLLTNQDLPAYEAFIKPRTDEGFFLRSNAAKAGLDYHGQALESDYAACFEDGRIVAVAAYSWLNTILVLGEPEAMRGLADLLRPCIAARGGVIEAVLGLRPEAAAFTEALGLAPADYRSDKEDWLFRLKIQDLKIPAPCESPAFSVRLAQKSDFALLVDWRVDYNVEAVAATPDAALRASVEEEMGRRIELNELYILEADGIPVSFCGYYGHIPESIMIGPVWTPLALRRRGYAKRALAGLIQAKMNDMPDLESVILFASEPDAIKVYTGLGFVKIADWRLAMVRGDYRLPEAVRTEVA